MKIINMFLTITKTLHPIFEINMPEGALKEAIINHFAKIQDMSNINFLRLIGPYMLGRIKFEKLVDENSNLELEEILDSKKRESV